jgi:multidrug efflux system outer membrane protein
MTVLLLTACTVGPDYQRPDVALPSNYSDAQQETTTTETISRDWWKLYNDTTLNELVATTLHNNRDLQRAVAQIDEAEAVLAETGASLFPQINLDGSSSRTRASTLNAQPLDAGAAVITNSNKLALSTNFELDFWGKLKRAKEGARAQLLGTRHAHDVIALTLAGATAQSYFTLRSLDAQITLTEQTFTSRGEALNVFKSRAKGGVASDLEVNQAQVAHSDASLQLRELQRQRALIEHQLGLISGQPGLKIAATPEATLPTATQPPHGLPSTLIERRPDVHQAEQTLVAANAKIGYTKAAQLPTFSLTGAFGGQSEELGDVLKSGARIWSVGLNATLPVIDGGKYSARTKGAEAVQRQALANYQKSVETAFKEVADALTNVEQSSASTNDLQTRADAARNALRLSRLRYDAGYSNYLEVLDAQRNANNAEQALLQNQQAQLVYSIDLMKALGGGWSENEAAPITQVKN